MSWVARCGKRPHGIVTQDELFALVAMAVRIGRHCELCEGAVAGLLHCNDCGRTWRLCDLHRPTTEIVQHLKKCHAAICEPVKGSG